MDFNKVETGWNNYDTKNESFIYKNEQKINVFHVKTIEALNALSGYAKYKNRSKVKVYFRGQTKLYPQLAPSLYRGVSCSGTISTRNEKIANYIKECSANVDSIKTLDNYAREPLLQHYGIKTKWLDIVDNLFVALWFSLHNIKKIRQTKYEGRYYDMITPREDFEGFAYILLLASDAFSEDHKHSGLYIGKETKVIDLRYAAPSIFLRPHCQHGLLMRPRKCDFPEDVNLLKYVVLIIKIRVKSAFDWLGNGRMMMAENMYPSPFYDCGYAHLLEQMQYDQNFANNFGSINYIGYKR